uniref:Putative transcription elongation factor SII n=1 Tax=Erythrocytic necrosis virus TaxID=1543320 RepID=A0A4D6QI80_9VIRU|nr:putative transcription elongation factor SII [Erythrocytic necrosis virus]
MEEFDDYFSHPVYSRLAAAESVIDKFLKIKNFVEEGVIQCGKCKSKRVFTVGKQVRAADEPMTTFCFCANCKSKWTE